MDGDGRALKPRDNCDETKPASRRGHGFKLWSSRKWTGRTDGRGHATAPRLELKCLFYPERMTLSA